MPNWKADKGEVPSAPLARVSLKAPQSLEKRHNNWSRTFLWTPSSSKPSTLLLESSYSFTEASLERSIYKTSGILWTAKISGMRIISTWGCTQQLSQQSLFQVSEHCNSVFVWRIINNLQQGTLFFQLICPWSLSSWAIETNISTKQMGCNALGNKKSIAVSWPLSSLLET